MRVYKLPQWLKPEQSKKIVQALCSRMQNGHFEIIEDDFDKFIVHTGAKENVRLTETILYLDGILVGFLLAKIG